MEKLLSVIVPVYNVEQYLEQCVDSIIQQTYNNIEIILVDDGSTDLSGKMCDKFQEKDNRIKVIHQGKQGVLKARLNGVKESNGSYTTFVDSDDWIAKDMYENLLGIMDEQKVDLVISGQFHYFDEENISKAKSVLIEGRYNREMIEKKVLPDMLWSARNDNWQVFPSLCTKIFRKEILLKYLVKASELNIHYGEDPSIIYPMILEINSLYITHNTYYFYRQKRGKELPLYLYDEQYLEKLFDLYIYFKEIFKKSKHTEVMEKQLDYFYMKSVQLKKMTYGCTFREIAYENCYLGNRWTLLSI